MNMFQHIAKTATVGAVTILFAVSFAAAEEGGRYWVPTTRTPPHTGYRQRRAPPALQPGVAARPQTVRHHAHA